MLIFFLIRKPLIIEKYLWMKTPELSVIYLLILRELLIKVI